MRNLILLASLFLALPAHAERAVTEGKSSTLTAIFVSSTQARVGISTGIPQYTLDVNGDAYATEHRGGGSYLTGIPSSGGVSGLVNAALVSAQTNISTQAAADRVAWQGNISTQAAADRLAWETNISTSGAGWTLAYQNNIATQAAADRLAWQNNISTAISAIPPTEVSTNTLTGTVQVGQGGTGQTSLNLVSVGSATVSTYTTGNANTVTNGAYTNSANHFSANQAMDSGATVSTLTVTGSALSVGGAVLNGDSANSFTVPTASVSISGNGFVVGTSTLVVRNGMVRIGKGSPEVEALFLLDVADSFSYASTYDIAKFGGDRQIRIGKRAVGYGVTDGNPSIQARDSNPPGGGVYPLLLNPDGGSVGINTTFPRSQLDVSGTFDWGSGATKSTGTATGSLTLAAGAALSAPNVTSSMTVSGRDASGYSLNLAGGLTAGGNIITTKGVTASTMTFACLSAAPSPLVEHQQYVLCSDSQTYSVQNGAAVQLSTGASGGGGTVAIANGGTGQTTAAAAIAALLPVRTRQVLTTGTAATYTCPANARQLIIRMVGGGGGGGSSYVGNPGTAGGDTIFNSISAKGGAGGPSNPGVGAAGAANSGSGTGSASIRIQGSGTTGAINAGSGGGGGAPSPFGGAGYGGYLTAAAGAAISNSGSGGGAGGSSSGGGGAGGGAGEYVELVVNSPSGTYTYTIGAAGAGGTQISGYSGAAGGSGVIIVDEFY